MNLSDSVETLAYIGPSYAKKLAKLGVYSVFDLIHHIPFRFIDFRNTTTIKGLTPGEFVTLKGEVTKAINQYTKTGKKLQLFSLTDETGEIMLVWFNQPFILNSIKIGDNISVAGKVDWFGRKLAIVSPEFEKIDQQVHTGRLLPVYHETLGISSKWLRKRLAEIFAKNIHIDEFLPATILASQNLVDFPTALKFAHFPQNEEEFTKGKKRLAFNEFLFMHLGSLIRKKQWQKTDVAYKLAINPKSLDEFRKSLPFSLTTSQNQAIEDIAKDMSQTTPMNRLLEGDVGSGKTVVAAAGCFLSFINGYQSLVMAPTQILANQHYTTLKNLFEPFGIGVQLVTSQTKKTTRDDANNGDSSKVDIYVGTHALIHQKLNLERVAFIVIDEQHRFGVEQRNHLITKTKTTDQVAHILTMTATPIPRTVAMSMYGDLDLSVLNQSPKGRQKITTWLVPPAKRQGAYTWIDNQIKTNQVQAYVVCPLIEDSQAETMQTLKSAKTEFDKLTKIFTHQKLGLLHGKQKTLDKQQVLDEFKKGNIHILVSTPVVEVGIDVANATIMVIETPERFGLAQLHQLRGRVGRGEKKSYCLLMAEKEDSQTNSRLEALKTSHSGFELAELDLKLRGPGEMFGTRQSGFPELKIANWQDTGDLVESRKIAQTLVDNQAVIHTYDRFIVPTLTKLTT